MGDIENDEIATERWDDEGGHLANRRHRTGRDHSENALQEHGEEKDGDDETDTIAPSLTSTSRSREPHHIAHFPPL